MSTLTVDKVLDCREVLCPLPVIQTSQAIQEIEVGQVLKVLATDPGSPADIEAWARQTGHELISSGQEDGAFAFYIRRTH
ncbi:MAG: sulfurtransferase TusA family protein [Chloroflexi bacterium]|nr:MAG: sulfurtransferase TusA family protein [Chloroflexota bacterium]